VVWVVGASAWGQEAAVQAPQSDVAAVPTPINVGQVALDRYVAEPDDAYQWQIVERRVEQGLTTYIVDMTSQRWLRPDEVDRPVWQHWVRIARPAQAASDTALLYIGGGRNGREAPRGIDERFRQVALATNSVVVELGMVPNQPLIFHNDGQPRVEDDLIAYTWSHYLKTGDERWPARLPMVKSVVRAMDTVQAVLAQDEAPLQINSRASWPSCPS
jgi:PhoPQ-activated pathogenicity-related protein